MNMQEKVSVNTLYTRSVNLERDIVSTEGIRSYIVTDNALQLLRHFHETHKKPGSPKAWCLVSPYGTGKSSFAVFLSCLLRAFQGNEHREAIKKLAQSDGKLAAAFKRAAGKSGHCMVLLTGSPEPLANRLAHSLEHAAREYWEGARGKRPNVLEELSGLARKKKIKISEVMNAVVNLQQAVHNKGGGGLTIIIDELGKFLEYEVRHHDANDIHLLQTLAEKTVNKSVGTLSILVMLHQSFEQYAKGRGRVLQNEWEKVRGRYETASFVEPVQQTLRIVQAALDNQFTGGERARIKSLAQAIRKGLLQSHSLPDGLNAKEADAVFQGCYPLHPVALLILSVLCQKVAQNERTLFSYLGSREKHGFQDSLKSLNKVGEWIYPSDIYDYFMLNRVYSSHDHLIQRRWVEVTTALDRLGDAQADDIRVLKTIGLLNVIGSQGEFRASKEVLRLCLPKKGAVDQSIKRLRDKSIITYRKYSDEFRVWQGSDFDIEGEVGNAKEKFGRFPLAEKLNYRHAMPPIVARKHTIEKGALRYYLPVFVDAVSYRQAGSECDVPRIVFYLSAGVREDKERFRQKIKPYYSDADIIVECAQGEQLREKVAESLALETIQKESPALHSDPIASRELKDRYAVALIEERNAIGDILNRANESSWFWRGEKLNIKDKYSLQQELSGAMDTIYHATPIIKNEIINRSNLSGQGNAARKQLLLALFSGQDREDLGLEKFPPEKAIYRAMLKASGLHRQIKGQWQLSEPDKADSCNFLPVWRRLESFLEQSEKQPMCFQELDAELSAPPYGLKAGVLPALYFACYLVNQHEVALYEDGKYTPYLTEELVERYARKPDSFSVQRFRIEGIRASLFKHYASLLKGTKKTYTLIDLTKPLVGFFDGLPEYTSKTGKVSKTAKEVRKAFAYAKSPKDLLYEALPKACGYGSSIRGTKEGKDFIDTLTRALRELKSAYPVMLEEQKKIICETFGLPHETDTAKLRAKLVGRLVALDRYTIDVHGAKGLLIRINNEDIDEDAWLKGILTFLAKGKPPRKWDDTDRNLFEYKLLEYSEHIKDLEKIRLYADSHSDGEKNYKFILLKAISSGEVAREEIVAIDNESLEIVNQIKDKVMSELRERDDKDIQLSVLATLTKEFLESYKSDGKKEKGDAQSTAKDVPDMNDEVAL
ncbi:MAG: hypothetical protein OXU34_03575 [Gammaproteobacteria bacterium]|nr:hypothetical protein [Gammaproteobacteria bacterium]